MGKVEQLLLYVFTCLLLVACQPTDKRALKVGANDWLGYQPLFTAQSLGLIDRNEINIVELGSSTEVLRALYNGSLDLAALTLDETIMALDQGRNIKVLMVMDFSYGGDALLAKDTITTLQELKGKKIAVENTALGAVMLDAVLKKAGLKVKDITIKSATYDEHERQLLSGDADAVITFDPLRSKLLALGYRELFNTREIPGTIIDILAVNESTLQKHPQRIKRLLSGYFKALQLIKSKDLSAIATISKRVGLNRDAVVLGFDQIKLPDLEENKTLMTKCSSGFDGVVERLAKIMMERDMISSMVNFQTACDNLYVNELTL